VPVTAKLSKAFYDRLGEDVANELVEWFNLIDATYRSDLKESNELNWTRFEARLNQGLVELRADLTDALPSEIRQQTRSMIGIIVALWTALLIPILGLWFRI